jgi:HD-like signal output (HDOD) protein
VADLFFWRRKRQSVAMPAAAPAPLPVASTPIAVAAAATPLPAPMRQLYALALGDEAAHLALTRQDPAQTNLLLTASKTLAAIGTESRYIPRQPSMLAQLLETLSDDAASLRDLSRIVTQDAQLTGNMLRTANSAMYRVSDHPVESIERAAALLGTAGMRRLLAASLMQPLATGPTSGLGKFGDLIWEHSLCSAAAAEAWASRSQDSDAFTAHLLALMHGLGSGAVYRVVGDLCAAQPALHLEPATAVEALDTNSAVVAARIAAHWGLSERTRQALEAQSSAAPSSAVSPLSRSLQFGLTAGATVLLHRAGKVTAEQGLGAIEAAGFAGGPVPRIWDRLLLAYGRA